MPKRGGAVREAYINGNGGLIFGAALGDINDASGLYFDTCQNGSNVVLSIDGYASPDSAVSEQGKDAGIGILDLYYRYGSSLGEHLDGEFSMAILDENRWELLLLRDPMGARPLYYVRDGGRTAFASEIKGLIRFMGGCSVDRSRLREHVFSPCGKVRGSEIYNGLFEVERGGGCVISRLGVAPFVYRTDRSVSKETHDDYRAVSDGFVCPDEEGMRFMLTEILIAFDHPQFDAFMPCFIQDIAYARERGIGAVVDGTLCMDIDYSTDRRDRLCVATGARVRSVPPEKNYLGERELKKMERVLRDILTPDNRAILNYIFGSDWEGRLKREKNTARRIRTEGMLYQVCVWYDQYNVVLV